MTRKTIEAGRPWERIVGYSRAVLVDRVIEVSGTAAAGADGRILAPGDVYEQTRECLRIIGEALAELGATFEDVTRTRVFLRDPSQWEEAGRAHGEIFEEIRPATAFIGASGFVDPEILVEIEASALLQEDA